MFGHVIAHKGVQEIQLEVVLGVELFALCGLGVCIVIVGVAFVGKNSEQLLLPLQTKFGQDALLKIDLDALHRILHLH